MGEAGIEEAEEGVAFLVGECNDVDFVFASYAFVIISKIAQRNRVAVEGECGVMCTTVVNQCFYPFAVAAG